MTSRSAWWKAALVGAAWAAYRYLPLRVCLAPVPAAVTDRRLPAEHLRLFQSDIRVLIVTAHPDDTEFFLGGTLLRLAASGARLRLVVATDGDKGFYPWVRSDVLRRVRRQEQLTAAARWRAEEVVFLGHRDGRLRLSAMLIEQIERELRCFAPEYVLLFEHRRPPLIAHQDHLRAGEATLAAMKRVGSPAAPLFFATRAPNLFVDVSAYWRQRVTLLDHHRSQWDGLRSRPVRVAVTRTAHRDGRRIGTLAAEGLRYIST